MSLPSWKFVATEIQRYFLSLPRYQPGDLISQSNVETVLRGCEQLGWSVADGEQLTERSLADDNFLIRQMATEQGRKFLRQVGKASGGYRTIDQLSRTPDGKKHINFLVKHKDGYLLIDYIATTPGGHKLGKQMAQIHGGVNLNKPTERIYTAHQLLNELRKAYEEAMKDQARP